MMDDVSVAVNGRTIKVPRGCVAAAAVARAGVVVMRRAVLGEARSALCGMGICFECRITINGEPQMRGCQRVCEEGMELRTDG
jgi:hypothetical protein